MIQTVDTIKPGKADKVIQLKPFQDAFIFSEKRYPAFVGGWATGKSMCGIVRAMNMSETHRRNLGVIFRKEYTDLRDSTIKDFEEYTRLTVNSNREVKLANGSVIMFRHLEELNNIQNMNLGWFNIEQAEELDSDKEFFTLFGRLRRPDCFQTGFVTANTKGHNWIFDLWKMKKLENAELIEATTFDNQDVLSKEFLESLEQIKKNRPEIYNRFVLNSWEVDDTELIVIPYSVVIKNTNNKQYDQGITRKVTVCDVSGEGDDETVIYNLVNTKIESQEIYSHRSLMDTCGRVIAHAKQNGSNMICVDKVGEGSGVYSRLMEVFQGDDKMKIYGFDGRVKAPEGIDHETYANYKTYAWFKASKKIFLESRADIPNDEVLAKQLSSVTYEFKSNGKMSLTPKDEIKEKLKRSPDRADAYIMGLDALDQAIPVTGDNRNSGVYIPERFR